MIQVLTDEGRTMDFGALAWGSSKSLPLTLINRGQAGVPLRLTISSVSSLVILSRDFIAQQLITYCYLVILQSKSSWQCFSFDRFSNHDSSRNRTQVMPAGSCVTTQYLPPCDTSGQVHSLQVWVLFKAPNRANAKSM